MIPLKLSRQAVFRLVLVCGALLFTFLSVEVALRVMYAVDQAAGRDFEAVLRRPRDEPPRDQWGQYGLGDIMQASRYDDIIYELRPALTGRFVQAWLNISTAGLRDREYAIEKPAGTRRMVGLGDSIMFGWRVEESDCYLSQMETQLNARPPPYPRYEILNFAVPGYNTAMEVAVLERKALRYRPDIVILHFVNNDWGIPKFMKPPPQPMARNRFYAVDFVRARIGWLKDRETDPLLIGHHMEDLDDMERYDIQAQYRYMVGPSGFLRAMDRLAELAGQHGFTVLVVTGAMLHEQQGLIPQTAAAKGFLHVNAAPMTDLMLRERGIEPGPEAYAKHLRVAKGDPHPNPFGHAIYARAILETLEGAGAISTNASEAGAISGAMSPQTTWP